MFCGEKYDYQAKSGKTSKTLCSQGFEDLSFSHFSTEYKKLKG